MNKIIHPAARGNAQGVGNTNRSLEQTTASTQRTKTQAPAPVVVDCSEGPSVRGLHEQSGPSALGSPKPASTRLKHPRLRPQSTAQLTAALRLDERGLALALPRNPLDGQPLSQTLVRQLNALIDDVRAELAQIEPGHMAPSERFRGVELENQLGLACLYLGQLDQAQAHFERALKRYTTQSPDVQRTLGYRLYAPAAYNLARVAAARHEQGDRLAHEDQGLRHLFMAFSMCDLSKEHVDCLAELAMRDPWLDNLRPREGDKDAGNRTTSIKCAQDFLKIISGKVSSVEQIEAIGFPEVRPAQRYEYDVVVAGAGISGMKTAEELANQGYRVLVIDPRGVGGRLDSRQVHVDDLPPDWGGHWLHFYRGIKDDDPRNDYELNNFFEWAVEQGGFDPFEDNSDIYNYGGGLKKFRKDLAEAGRKFEHAVELAVEAHKAAPPDQKHLFNKSCKDILDSIDMPAEVRPLAESLFVSAMSGAYAAHTTILGNFKSIGEGAEDAVVYESLGTVMAAYGKWARLQSQGRITVAKEGLGHIERHGDHVTVTLRDDKGNTRQLDSKKVVMSLPPSQIVKHGKELGLPAAKVKLFETNPMDNYKKIFLTFDQNVFKDFTSPWVITTDEREENVINFYVDHVAKGGKTVSALLVGGKVADEYDDLGDDAAIERALEDLARLLHQEFDMAEDKAQELVRASVVREQCATTDWKAQELFGGAYPNVSKNFISWSVLAEPVDGLIHFVGDALVPGQAGRMGSADGAWKSADRGAQEMLLDLYWQGYLPDWNRNAALAAAVPAYQQSQHAASQQLRKVNPEQAETWDIKKRDWDLERALGAKPEDTLIAFLRLAVEQKSRLTDLSPETLEALAQTYDVETENLRRVAETMDQQYPTGAALQKQLKRLERHAEMDRLIKEADARIKRKEKGK